MEQLLANILGQTRKATLHGREYIVAPVSMIVPGVLNGSLGPLYYPEDEIAKNPIAWNGMPIVVNHPVVEGKPVSARSPQILERYQIGSVFETNVNGKLVAEGWFDVELTRKIEPRILAALNSGQPIELSTGLFTDNEEAPAGATYNGVAYTHVARNYRPDHLAVLPDARGACSLKDGCGVLVNEESKQTLVNQILALFGLNATKDGHPSGSSTTPKQEMPDMAKLTEAQRKELVDGIIANSCGCWAETDRELLAKFDDIKLNALKESGEKAKANELAANAASKGITDKEGNEYAFNAESGKWDLKPAPKKPETATHAANKEAAVIAPTHDNAASRLTPEEQEAIAFARNERTRQKSDAIAKLTANVKTDAEKKALTAVYNKLDLADLNAMVAALPAPKAPAVNGGYPAYAGAAGAAAPAVNQELDDDDVLIPPTMNWDEISRSNSQRERAAAN